MLHDAVSQNRTCRRFYENERIDRDTLVDLVDTARLVPSSGNRQPLKYCVVHDPALCARVFDCLSWAAALPDWPGPDQGERPSGYLVILHDKTLVLGELFTAWDEGIALQTIMLAAREKGYAACPIGAFKKKSLSEVLGIDRETLEPDLVVALGRPREEAVIEAMPTDGSPAYWRDDAQVHHVPKRSLDEVLIAQR
ncbi:nitroreductase family protein [Raoultibacter phocaeensis]|uniref:nitroreductase family protein n=1 Tax=Raoultibacter phocaeensis TaxID=2479841 RepID=UPI0011192D11|nr:nitroreductase family protein [Raoultibacter phocaeensis]